MHENPYIDTVKEDLFISEWYLLRFKMDFKFKKKAGMILKW